MALLAKHNDGQIYLSRPDLIDKYLADGWSVYQVGNDGTETLIGSQERGKLIDLVEKPQQSSGSAGSDAVTEALNIILNGE